MTSNATESSDTVPGDHDSMLAAPFVDALAKAVSTALCRITLEVEGA